MSMADTVSWTEPLCSVREQRDLGIECDPGSGELRGLVCMRGARCVAVRGVRWAHYGREVLAGQFLRPGRAHASRACAEFGDEWDCERERDHGGAQVLAASIATRRSVPRWQWYLGIECDCGCGEMRGAACMRVAGRLPVRERR